MSIFSDSSSLTESWDSVLIGEETVESVLTGDTTSDFIVGDSESVGDVSDALVDSVFFVVGGALLKKEDIPPFFLAPEVGVVFAVS